METFAKSVVVVSSQSAMDKYAAPQVRTYVCQDAEQLAFILNREGMGTYAMRGISVRTITVVEE
jgi:hypothetical protein